MNDSAGRFLRRRSEQVDDAPPLVRAAAVRGARETRAVPQPDYGAPPVAPLMLIVQPGRAPRVDPASMATTLGPAQAESRVAVRLAEGQSVRDMAESTGHTPGASYWHLKQIYQQLLISRQVDLARLVLAIAECG